MTTTKTKTPLSEDEVIALMGEALPGGFFKAPKDEIPGFRSMTVDMVNATVTLDARRFRVMLQAIAEAESVEKVLTEEHEAIRRAQQILGAAQSGLRSALVFNRMKV